MTPITEDYVSFETAKLLKAKGFDEYCFCVNYPTERGSYNITLPTRINNSTIPFANEYKLCRYKEDLITVPTLQMATKWLRLKHNLCVIPVMTSKTLREEYGCWEVDIYYYKGEFAGIDATINACGHIFGETPEKVLEEGIKYCLENLI